MVANGLPEGNCRHETSPFRKCGGGWVYSLLIAHKLGMVLFVRVFWPGSIFFYLSNRRRTSAVDLTDTLTPEETGHVLLLECGDPPQHLIHRSQLEGRQRVTFTDQIDVRVQNLALLLI